MLIVHWKVAAYFFDEGDYPSRPSVSHQKEPIMWSGQRMLVLWEHHQKGMLPSSFISKEECFKISIKDDLFSEKYLKFSCDAFKCFTHWISNRKHVSYYYLWKDILSNSSIALCATQCRIYNCFLKLKRKTKCI